MKTGAEPRKVAILAGLVAVAGVIYYVESSDSPSPEPVSAPRAAVAPPLPAPAPAARAKGPKTERRAETNASLIKDWKPRLGPQNPEDRPDPATVDPTLRLELLARVQSVQAGSAGRNLFVFGAAPPPPAVAVAKLPKVPPIRVTAPQQPPSNVGTYVPSAPPAPQAPQMTFKYYGYKISKSDGHKAAFLLDGDDILIAGENDTVKHRYRVVKINVNSITIEDTEFKSSQTLLLQETPSG